MLLAVCLPDNVKLRVCRYCIIFQSAYACVAPRMHFRKHGHICALTEVAPNTYAIAQPLSPLFSAGGGHISGTVFAQHTASLQHLLCLYEWVPCSLTFLQESKSLWMCECVCVLLSYTPFIRVFFSFLFLLLYCFLSLLILFCLLYHFPPSPDAHQALASSDSAGFFRVALSDPQCEVHPTHIL